MPFPPVVPSVDLNGFASANRHFRRAAPCSNRLVVSMRRLRDEMPFVTSNLTCSRTDLATTSLCSLTISRWAYSSLFLMLHYNPHFSWQLRR